MFLKKVYNEYIGILWDEECKDEESIYIKSYLKKLQEF